MFFVHLDELFLVAAQLVADVAHQLLEQHLQRDDAGGAAVLVDDDRHLLAGAAASGRSRRRRTSSPGTNSGLRIARSMRSFVVQRAVGDAAQHVLDVDDADDVVVRALEDREAGVRRFQVHLVEVAGRCPRCQEDDLGARDHHLVDAAVAEAEDAAEQLGLLLLQQAGLRALVDEQVDLLRRVRRCARRLPPRLIPNGRRTALARPFSSQIAGQKTSAEHLHRRRPWPATTRSARKSARLFGASSPRTMCSAVMMAKAIGTATAWELMPANFSPKTSSKTGSSMSARTGSPTKPRPMLAMVMPSCVAAR